MNAHSDQSPPPLFTLLQEEAKKHGELLDGTDSKFMAKLEALSARIPREYEILQVFRAFLADPEHQRVFWFPDRFEKYRHRLSSASPDSQQTEKPEPARCPQCKALLHPEGPDGLIPCSSCRRWYRLVNGRLVVVSVPQETADWHAELRRKLEQA